MLWGVLRIHLESNGVISAERTPSTRDKLCELFMSHASYSDDLPPNEIPNPSVDTYASDLVAIQELLLRGNVSN